MIDAGWNPRYAELVARQQAQAKKHRRQLFVACMASLIAIGLAIVFGLHFVAWAHGG